MSIPFLSCNHLKSRCHIFGVPPAMTQTADPLAELLTPLLARDAGAVAAFVRSMAPPVLRVVRQIMGSAHPEVADVVQEALLAALHALPSFRHQCTVLHFVCRVAALTAMNARRRVQLREQITQTSGSIDEYADESATPLAATLAARRRGAFRRLLDELPAAQAEVLALHCVLGFSIHETADTTGAPINTVRGRLLTAKAALRARLANDPELCELLQGVS